jgi:hypothetical protein
MDTQTTEDDCEANLAPVGELPASEVPSNSSVDPNVDSIEVLGGHGAQAVREDPDFLENLQPEDQNQGVISEEGNSNLLRLSFLRKLWMIVEKKSFKFVCWKDNRDTLITGVDLSQWEILYYYYYYYYYSFIHMCIHCLGHFSPLPPSPTLSPPTPSLPGRTCCALISNFVEEKT